MTHTNGDSAEARNGCEAAGFNGNLSEAHVSAAGNVDPAGAHTRAAGMTHHNLPPLDDVSAGAIFTSIMPRDADGADEAISTPIGVEGSNVTMA